MSHKLLIYAQVAHENYDVYDLRDTLRIIILIYGIIRPDMQHQIAISMALSHMLATNKLNKTNAIVLLKEIMERLESDLPKMDKTVKIEYVVHYLTEIAKGQDGIAGTDDDIISPDVMKDLQKMTETSVLRDILNLCSDVIKNKKVNSTKLSLCCLKTFT